MRYFVIICLLSPIFVAMFYVNGENYKKHVEIQENIINHPENLPTSESARISSSSFTNIMADMYWLRAVQYIGENVIGWEYKLYLWVMMNLITDLNPYFESPYVIGQLLLPSNETDRDEKFSESEMFQNVLAWEKLWLKWVENFCDIEKVQTIFEENDLGKIINDESGKYSNPCKSYKIPYYLAYIYFYYMDDGLTSANYYKVVSAQKDAPRGARILSAIMQGKWGEREKSLFMFLSLAKSLSNETESCNALSTELENTYSYLTSEWLEITGELVERIELFSRQVLPKLSEENENEVLSDTECSNYLAKAVREINLMYLETADQAFVSDNPESISAQNPETLFENWYIDFIPTDFQQYEWEDYGIVYRYNEDIKRFDYEMGVKK